MKLSSCLLAILALSTYPITSRADDAELRTVTARKLKLKVPADWKVVKTTSNMRAAQFAIPGEDDSADLVVFYFGGGATGGVQANVNRWIGQFAEDDRKIEMSQGKIEGGTFIIVDAVGTWNKPDGPPFAQKKIKTPNSRVVNAIVIQDDDGKEDHYFLKLSGNKDLVAKHTAALRRAIGVKPDSEKPFNLKDAPN